MPEFETPAFLENKSTDEIHETMLAALPADLDTSEGGHTWNLTRPTALVLAEMCEFVLPEVIKLIFPEWSYGTFLDEHAKGRGITRRAATAAIGKITITGTAGAVIPAGSLFSTASVNGEPSVDFKTTAAATIPSSGSITVDIQCTQGGIVGNTAANTIVLVGSRINGVTAVTNANATSGGTEEESDASLIERICEFDKSQGESFIGCVADYKRWATSVSGVGDAVIITPTDDSGLIKIILTDANGAAATTALCNKVYNYIMSPDNPAARLAPVNANLSVVPPDSIAIAIKATVELEPGYTLAGVKAAYLAQIASYLPQAMDEGEIKYTRLAAALAAVEGANDYSNLQIGVKSSDGSVTYGTSNISITNSQLPSVSESDLTLTSGTVS